MIGRAMNHYFNDMSINVFSSDINEIIMFLYIKNHNLMYNKRISYRTSIDSVPLDSILYYTESNQVSNKQRTFILYINDIVVQVFDDAESERKTFSIWAPSYDKIVEGVNLVHDMFPETEDDDQHQVFINIWYMNGDFARASSSTITVCDWKDIRSNYAPLVAANLDALINDGESVLTRNNASGKLILWHGEAGTGKTYALRALMSSWKSFAAINYITDPEALFHQPSYLIDMVLSVDDEASKKWNLIVCEDSGSFLSVHAPSDEGYALSRLLNVTDGILGQGMNVVIIMTSNEKIERFHPAVTRPGRCLSSVEFTRLSVSDANRWLSEHGNRHTVDSPASIAELYAILDGRPVVKTGTRNILGFATE